MTTIPLSRFFKTNWWNSHHNRCSKLTRNYHETIIIEDSIAADLNRYQNVWAKFLQPLRDLNCGFWGDKVQHVLWRSHNPPVVKSIKRVAVLCGTNNLNQDSPEDITDGILDLASTFKSKYRSIKIFVCGILPRDFSWSATQVYIKEVNNIFKTKCSQSCFTFICPDNDWTLSNGSLKLVSFHSSLLCKFYTTSKFKRINNKSFHRILLILSSNISLNPGPVSNSQSFCSNEWNVFKAKGIHAWLHQILESISLIHLNVNSLLPKIDKIRYIAARTNVAVIGISESKLD